MKQHFQIPPNTWDSCIIIIYAYIAARELKSKVLQLATWSWSLEVVDGAHAYQRPARIADQFGYNPAIYSKSGVEFINVLAI